MPDPMSRNQKTMDSPPASLESQRSQRDFSFDFLLSSAKKQRDASKGRKLKTQILCAFCGSAVNKVLNLNGKSIDNYYRINK
jgi:hypothetical protein